MQVTLKKAAELSRAALAAAKAVEPKANASLSVFSLADVSEVVETGRKDFTASLDRSIALVNVSYEIRDLIGTANSAAGVDKLLTKVAAIDEVVARITAALPGADKLFGGESGSDSDDMEALKRRVEQARKDITDAETRRYGGGREDVKIAVLGSEQKKSLTDLVGSYKRKRAALKDELTAINFGTKITLPERLVETLRDEKLID